MASVEPAGEVGDRVDGAAAGDRRDLGDVVACGEGFRQLAHERGEAAVVADACPIATAGEIGVEDDLGDASPRAAVASGGGGTIGEAAIDERQPCCLPDGIVDHRQAAEQGRVASPPAERPDGRQPHRCLVVARCRFQERGRCDARHGAGGFDEPGAGRAIGRSQRAEQRSEHTGGVSVGPPGQRALGEHGAEAAFGDARSEAPHGRGVGWARRERPGGVLGDEPPPVVQGIGESARGRRTWHGAQCVDAGDRSELIAALLHQFDERSDHASAAGRAARRPLQLLGGPQSRDDRRRRQHVVDETTKPS